LLRIDEYALKEILQDSSDLKDCLRNECKYNQSCVRIRRNGVVGGDKQIISI